MNEQLLTACGIAETQFWLETTGKPILSQLTNSDAVGGALIDDLRSLRESAPAAPSPLKLAQAGASAQTVEPSSRKPSESFGRRTLAAIVQFTRFAFETFSLISLLAVMTALPLVQLVSFGYLLDVSGKLTRGATLRDAVAWRATAGRIGLALLALFVLSLPIRLLSHWATVAEVISPGTVRAELLRSVAIVLAVAAVMHLGWAWARGGRLVHYLWPAPLRWIRNAWRPRIWLDAADAWLAMIGSMELPRLFWLGLRGAVGTLLWLSPATVIILVNRNGQSGLAGLIGAVSLVCLGIALMYLPMLQANFAADNRLRSLFAVKTVRADFRRAPWAWLGAMILTLVVLPIPLYLLKIEPPPAELIWLPTWFFIALMLPARIASGMAMRRARSKAEPSGWWAAFSRWIVRLLMPPVVGVYLLFVYLSQYVSWDGLQTWVQQHAVLVPVPFVGG
ncbi:MAG: DUF4013 domain-containing protein [Planctomycetaceae bacterium]